jgi:MoxR-like ATPase
MIPLFYVGDGKHQPGNPKKLPVSPRAQLLIEPNNYIVDPGLRDACNVAILLGQPLLLTGEPGTGKTQFAYSLAWELGLGEPLKFETKSTSTARDLFYTYDALKHFRNIQTGVASTQVLDYLNYQALGLAILRTRNPDEVREFLPLDFPDSGQIRSIVLIDEIDKAPRDFPNDLLNELELMYFRIPELGNAKISVNTELQPIVIITSNSEKDLPDAFLRRCIYYNIPFPSSEQLEHIIASRLGINIGDPFLQSVLSLFHEFRAARNGLKKKPATSELLSWLLALQKLNRESESTADNSLISKDLIFSTLTSLIKTSEDQEKAKKVVEQWIEKQKQTT